MAVIYTEEGRENNYQLLPFRLQKSLEIKENFIRKFDILTISEWNEKYPQFPLRRYKKIS